VRKMTEMSQRKKNGYEHIIFDVVCLYSGRRYIEVEYFSALQTISSRSSTNYFILDKWVFG